MKQKLLQALVVLLAGLGAHAQVNSGSNGTKQLTSTRSP